MSDIIPSTRARSLRVSKGIRVDFDDESVDYQAYGSFIATQMKNRTSYDPFNYVLSVGNRVEGFDENYVAGVDSELPPDGGVRIYLKPNGSPARACILYHASGVADYGLLKESLIKRIFDRRYEVDSSTIKEIPEEPKPKDRGDVRSGGVGATQKPVVPPHPPKSDVPPLSPKEGLSLLSRIANEIARAPRDNADRIVHREVTQAICRAKGISFDTARPGDYLSYPGQLMRIGVLRKDELDPSLYVVDVGLLARCAKGEELPHVVKWGRRNVADRNSDGSRRAKKEKTVRKNSGGQQPGKPPETLSGEEEIDTVITVRRHSRDLMVQLKVAQETLRGLQGQLERCLQEVTELVAKCDKSFENSS